MADWVGLGFGILVIAIALTMADVFPWVGLGFGILAIAIALTCLIMRDYRRCECCCHCPEQREEEYPEEVWKSAAANEDDEVVEDV